MRTRMVVGRVVMGLVVSGFIFSRLAQAEGPPEIGEVAPEIEGEDLDGEVFRLSDYRGKVVVLDFWGNW